MDTCCWIISDNRLHPTSGVQQSKRWYRSIRVLCGSLENNLGNCHSVPNLELRKRSGETSQLDLILSFLRTAIQTIVRHIYRSLPIKNADLSISTNCRILEYLHVVPLLFKLTWNQYISCSTVGNMYGATFPTCRECNRWGHQGSWWLESQLIDPKKLLQDAKNKIGKENSILAVTIPGWLCIYFF